MPKIPFANNKLTNFLLETLTLILSKFELSFDLNLNTLMNAPSMELGLIQLIRFNTIEEKLHSMMQTNQMSARDKVTVD